jgi:hypothetical protein
VHKVVKWQPPNEGVVSFTFISSRRPPKDDSSRSEAELQLYLTDLSATNMLRLITLRHVGIGSLLEGAHARPILSDLQCRLKRVAFISIYCSCHPPHRYTLPPNQEIE